LRINLIAYRKRLATFTMGTAALALALVGTSGLAADWKPEKSV